VTGQDVVVLSAYGAGGAVAAGVVGGVALAAARRRSVRTQAAIVALTGVGAMAAGVLAAASAMFTAHDTEALLVMVGASGAVGVACALVLGQRVAGATRSLSSLARRIGEGERLAGGVGSPAPGELQSLARELEDMSARLDEARRQQERLDASRRELVAWVSHDLRTPLAGIRAMAEALEDQVVDAPADVARYHRTMREEADRLAGLVDDLFELSRIHAGALQLRPEPVQLGELVSDAVAGAGAAARAKGVRVEGRVDGDDPVVELSTSEALRVLRNLLDNAIRHTPSDGTVIVEAGVTGDDAFVDVRDACGGIPLADLGRVFEPAFRGDLARTPADGGGGLGLAIARGLVEAHHGRITVANDGDGCRFTVRLPRSQP
jgi:signal transduction histidine kinase